MTQVGDYRFFVGPAQRSLFLRRTGHPEQLPIHRRGFLRRQDICSIVLEVPNSVLGPKEVAYGPHAHSGKRRGRALGQADRGARPNQTPFLAGEQNAAYLAGSRRTMPTSFSSSRHAWSIRGGYNQGKQGGGRDTVAGHHWLRSRTRPRPSRTMAGHQRERSGHRPPAPRPGRQRSARRQGREFDWAARAAIRLDPAPPAPFAGMSVRAHRPTSFGPEQSWVLPADAANVLFGEEILAGELEVVQGAL